MDTYPSIHARYGSMINIVDKWILACFVVEILIRFGAVMSRLDQLATEIASLKNRLS